MIQLEIVPRRRLRSVLLTILVVVAILASSYLLFVYEPGGASAGAAPGLLASRRAMRERIVELTTEADALHRRIAILERDRQVEGKAYRDVEVHLLELQGEILALREEVAFYEAIVSSPATKRLSIQTISLEPVGPGSVWRFQVVLTRNTKNDNVLAGTIGLSVDGEQKGEPRRLFLSELTVERVGTLSFQFRYFQRLEGRLILPPDFVPQKVVVRVTETGASGPPVERSFDWPVPVS